MKKQWLIILLCITLVSVMSNTVCGSEIHETVKDETVYISLNYDGSVKEVMVVNHIATPVTATYVDYGNYTAIENITGKEKPKVEGNKITWNLTKNENGFYYIGKMKDVELPWIFDFSYSLNNQPVTAKDLAGASGKVKIKIKATPNERVDTYFQENMSMQLSQALNTDICTNINAPNGTPVLAGKTNTVSFMTMPRGYLNETISFDAKNLELNGISIILSPFSLSNFSTFSDLESGVSSILDAMNALISGTQKLETGISSASDAVGQLSTGSQELANSQEEVAQGMNQYQQGLGAFSGYISSFAREMEKSLDTFDQAGAKLESAKKELNGSAAKIQGAISDIDKTTAATQEQIAKLEDGLNGLSKGLSDMSSAVNQLLETNNGLSATLNKIAGGYETLLGGYQNVSANLAKLSTDTSAANAILNSATESSEAKALANSYIALAAGVSDAKSTLSSLNSSFTSANSEFKGGIAKISSGYQELNQGLEGLQGGIASLQKGLDGGFDFGTIKTQLFTLIKEMNNASALLGSLDLTSFAIDTKAYKANMSQLEQAVSSLNENFASINYGVNQQVFGGINQLNQGLNTLYGEFKKVPPNVSKLNSGQKELKSGIAGALDGVINTETDTTPVSFTAPGEIVPHTVQFIGATPQIVESTTVYQAPEKEESTLWQRVKELFQ